VKFLFRFDDIYIEVDREAKFELNIREYFPKVWSCHNPRKTGINKLPAVYTSWQKMAGEIAKKVHSAKEPRVYITLNGRNGSGKTLYGFYLLGYLRRAGISANHIDDIISLSENRGLPDGLKNVHPQAYEKFLPLTAKVIIIDDGWKEAMTIGCEDKGCLRNTALIKVHIWVRADVWDTRTWVKAGTHDHACLRKAYKSVDAEGFDLALDNTRPNATFNDYPKHIGCIDISDLMTFVEGK
jgi:hypothetical protein